MVWGKWMVAAMCPALIAGSAVARDRAPGGPSAPASTASIAVDARAMLMAEASVHGGEPGGTVHSIPALPGAGTPALAALVLDDDTDVRDTHALPIMYAPPAVWKVAAEPVRKSRLDAAPLERMSLEGSLDYRRTRNFGLDARLELRIDGREDSAMVSLAGRLARVVQTLERR